MTRPAWNFAGPCGRLGARAGSLLFLRVISKARTMPESNQWFKSGSADEGRVNLGWQVSSELARVEARRVLVQERLHQQVFLDHMVDQPGAQERAEACRRRCIPLVADLLF